MTRIAGWARQFGVARAVCLVLLFALIPLRLADPRPLEELRLRTFDFFQVLRPRVQDGYPVVIVDIDEASLKAIGQWPWPRTTVADLVTRITQLGGGRHRLRHHFCRTGPHVAGDRRTEFPRYRRRHPRQARQPAEQRRGVWPMRSSIRVSSSARPAPRPRPRRRRARRRCRPASPFSDPIRRLIW